MLVSMPDLSEITGRANLPVLEHDSCFLAVLDEKGVTWELGFGPMASIGRETWGHQVPKHARLRC